MEHDSIYFYGYWWMARLVFGRCGRFDLRINRICGRRLHNKKVLIFGYVGLANILDVYIIKTGSVLRTATLFFYISNEGLSLLENSAYLGLPVPDKIKSVLHQLHDRDVKEDSTDEDK